MEVHQAKVKERGDGWEVILLIRHDNGQLRSWAGHGRSVEEAYQAALAVAERYNGRQ